MKRKEAVAQIRAVRRRCRGALDPAAAKVVKALLSDGRIAQARRADAAGRKACGANFNTIVEAGPFDGEQHKYECSNCGATGLYRAPKFDIED